MVVGMKSKTGLVCPVLMGSMGSKELQELQVQTDRMERKASKGLGERLEKTVCQEKEALKALPESPEKKGLKDPKDLKVLQVLVLSQGEQLKQLM